MENNNYLPEAFTLEIKKLLGNEYDGFIKSYDKERAAGLRYNPLKCSYEEFIEAVDWTLNPVPWVHAKWTSNPVPWAYEGFYYPLTERPGKHPFHEAGAYYIQEPSAMSAVAVLDPKPGDYVLDLCSAPGGKSTQIAGRLNNTGLLVSNEIIKSRAQILSQNLERMGVRNFVCLNESSESLSKRFPYFFDKILVDAPCSGEGMFKKEENASSEWSEEHVLMCAKRQTDILNNAASMLKPGGVMVYSTCTFNPYENEGVINTFLNDHPEFTIEESPVAEFFAPGHPEWVPDSEGNPSLTNTMRLWPHKIDGEGHFVAKLKKAGELTDSSMKTVSVSKADEKKLKEIYDFLTDTVNVKPDVAKSLVSNSIPVTFGDNIYLLPRAVGGISGLKVERPGLHVAISKKNRLEPAHSLALALKPSDVNTFVTMDIETSEKFIAGETINSDPSLKGWTLMCAGPFSLGFGKASGGVIKNHYPKGLRINY